MSDHSAFLAEAGVAGFDHHGVAAETLVRARCVTGLGLSNCEAGVSIAERSTTLVTKSAAA